MSRDAVPRENHAQSRQVNTVSQFPGDPDCYSQSDSEDQAWDFRRENPRPRMIRRHREIYRPGTITDDEHEEEVYHVAPVTIRTKETKPRKPYERKPKKPQSSPEHTSNREESPAPEPMETMDVPFSESYAEEALLKDKAKKGPCQYEYNPWETISKLNTNVTIGQLAQIAPVVRSSIQHGLRTAKPTYGTVNSVKLMAKTPAYAIRKIGGLPIVLVCVEFEGCGEDRVLKR